MRPPNGGRMFARGLAVILAAVFIAVPAVAAAATVGENDYKDVVTLSSPAVSPDGKRAVVIVKRVVWSEDRHEGDLVMIDLSSHASRTLTYHRKDLSDPAFSPDGTRLAFIAEDDGDKDQVFVMPLDGGDARPVTHAKSGVDQFAWRPDGSALAYASTDPEPQRKGADRFRDSFIFTTEPIVARSRPRPVHLFLQPLDSQRATQLTFGSQSVATGEAESSISWSHDGKTLAFTLVPNAILNDESFSRIALVDVDTKKVRPLTDRSEWETTPLFSPDGAHLAYTYSSGDPQVALVHLYVTTPGGGEGTKLSGAIDGDVSDVAWSRDSKSLLVAVPEKSTLALYRIPLDGAPERLEMRVAVPGVPGTTTGAVSMSPMEGAIAPDGTIVMVASTSQQPPELFARTPDGGMTKLTNFNARVARFEFAAAERITFPTSTGITGDGVLYLPPGFSAGKKYPLSVYIHGGPTSESTLGFDFWAQVMAARGWLVLRPN
jgi:dipeptidyl aminopeptidase/acylaminoacyl peptidase